MREQVSELQIKQIMWIMLKFESPTFLESLAVYDRNNSCGV